MSKLNFFVLVVAISAVLYLIITKANTAISKAENTFRKEVVTPEQQAEDIVGEINISR
ncbi:MAG: hypothetical protein QG653_61 [Patescibacteria group bacterium]|nr:hypothetical protein [Patescibacteria group bacterium]